MLLEAVLAALVGAAALWLVLRPMFTPPVVRAVPLEPPDPEETEKGVALAALKEIEFDRETGKLSDADYDLLKRKYTAVALEALRAETPDEPVDVEAMIAHRVQALRGAPACAVCGPRPEPDAVFCSTCGQALSVAMGCGQCGAALPPQSRFCEACGCRVAA